MDNATVDTAPLTIHGLIPSFQLQAINRDAEITPWAYKQRSSLVILFFHDSTCEACSNLLLSFAQQYSTYRTLETEVVAIATTHESNLSTPLQQFAEHHSIPFPILWDQEGIVRQAYLGQHASSSAVGIFVCDRYGGLHMQAIADEADQLPSEADIRGWAEFVDMQSPGCCTPMW
ncbi:MAG: redoxin domain-containing protein [Leptolyngbyaceae bacterium]|nr:redoxin domain-containing protein [Leptolyngbyaceae bacterium]